MLAFTGAQIYWMVGAKADGMTVRPGQLWSIPSEKGAFGVLPAGDLSGLHDETDDLRNIICSEFPVPNYRIGVGEWPAGIALQRADAPMISQIKLMSDLEGPGLVQIAHRATEMTNVFSTREMNEDSLIKPRWRPTDEVDPGTQVEIDQSRAELYDLITKLPPVLIEKMGVLEEKELTELVNFLKAEEEQQQEVLAQGAQQTGGNW